MNNSNTFFHDQPVKPSENSLRSASLGAVFSFVPIFLLTGNFFTAIGLILCVFTFLLYVFRLGNSIPVLELMLLMAALQWILGAHIAYRLEFKHFKYIMYVDEGTYMGIVVPGYFFFLLSITIFYPKHDLPQITYKLQQLADRHFKMSVYLIVVGVLLPLASSFVPPWLRFIIFLLANLKYVGVTLILFRRNSKAKWRLFYLVMGLTLISSLQSGMFHDLFLWTALLISFVAIQIKISNFLKVAVMLGGFVFAFLLQGIKGQYREIMSGTNLTTVEKISLFVDLLMGQLDDTEENLDNSYIGMINVRLNEGWIISAVINNVPEFEPFANGETVYEAIYASLVPRIFDTEKKLAGGRENFERFTGLFIYNRTSMGISVLGEAYSNYGKVGSWIFMFIWGSFLCFAVRIIFKYGQNNPIVCVFISLIFLQVIKAETELYVVLNHLVKSSIFVFGLLWFARKFLKWKI